MQPGHILSRFPEYTEVMPLREGRARICREGLYGFIDAGGRESVAPFILLPELFVKAGPRCGCRKTIFI